MSTASAEDDRGVAEEQSTSTDEPAATSRLLKLLTSPWGGSLSRLLAKILRGTSDTDGNSAGESAIASIERNGRQQGAPTIEARVTQ
ncbi:MAG: hypothetical protein ABW110_06785 [Steroidobacteraceae bacterium]